MRLYPNRRSGECVTCKAKVAAKAGFVFRGAGNAWTVCCNSDKCIPVEVLKAHKDYEARQARKELTAEGELYFPYDPNALDLLRSFPATKDRTKKVWDSQKKCRNISLSPADRPRVLELCEKLGITVAPELQDIPKDDFVERALERCKEHPELYAFQPVGVEFLARREKAILADDMGLGKTVQALLAVDTSMGALVICPSSVKYSWEDEVRKWRPDMTPEVLEGRGSFRWPKPGEVVIANFEILPKWLMPVVIATTDDGKEIKGAAIPDLPSFREVSPRDVVLIVDEAHRGKNYRTQTHKKLKELGILCGRTWLLSGTPLPSRPTDLYGVLQMGLMDREVFGGWKGFVRCFQGSKSGWNGSYVWGSPLPEVAERMRRVMLRRMKDEVLPDLPPIVWKDVGVRGMSDILLRDMDSLISVCDAYLDEGMLPPFEMISKIRAKLSKSRIPVMEQMVEDFEDAGEPLVVFSAYKAPIEVLAKRDGWGVITGDETAKQRREVVRDFQAGKLKGVGLTIRAGGEGITLTRASNVLFVDLEWTPAHNNQAIDRLRRIGQKGASIQVIRMFSDHPLDRRVHQILGEKMRLIQKAIEDSINYEIPAEKKGLDIRSESQADFDARMAAIEAAAKKLEEDQAKQRFTDGAWLQGERAKASRPEVEITPVVADKLRSALDFMLQRCDGAHARDDVGFNKPDAGRARILALTGLKEDGELRAAERMLSRYHRQLEARYPEIFA